MHGLRQMRKSSSNAPTWAEVITDAQAEIARAERRIQTLKHVIVNARIKVENEEPFPGQDGFIGQGAD